MEYDLDEDDGNVATRGSISKKCGFPMLFIVIFVELASTMILVTVSRDIALWTSVKRGNNWTEEEHNHDFIPNGYGETTCISKHDALLHQHGKPSNYLKYKLRSYEARHKKCGPYSDSYNKAILVLRYGNASQVSSQDCRYIVYKPTVDGLANKMISLISTFLYALLTDRVLLINRDNNLKGLFCEPFPETSWLLPSDFPKIDNTFVKQINFEDLVLEKNKSVGQSNYIFIQGSKPYNDQDNMFFCDEGQSLLKNFSWLVMQSNQYFVPSIFFIPNFQQELDRLFPDKELVFHLLSRYLYHPNNYVWGLVRRFYDGYLSKADMRVGIQVRFFDQEISLKNIVDQVISCIVNEGILPNIIQQREQNQQMTKSNNDTTTIAVLMASLNGKVYEEMKQLFWRNPTLTGQIVTIYQPSYEGIQRSGETDHDAMALAEIYLLSLSDKLITSSFSTFGYAAQGIGGLRPWMLNHFMRENYPVPDPPCTRTITMEPCHHFPPELKCSNVKEIPKVAYVTHCEDFENGIKLVSNGV